MRWYHSLTAIQRRVLWGLALSVILVIGLLGWSVWTTLTSQTAHSPLPTTTFQDSILPSPSPSPPPTRTPSPTPTSPATSTPLPPFDVAQAGLIAVGVSDARGLLPRWSTPLTLVDAHNMSVVLYEHYTTHPPLPLHIQTTLQALRLWLWEDEQVRVDPVAQATALAALYASDTDELYARRDWTGLRDIAEWQIAYGYARAIPNQYGQLSQLIANADSLDRRLALTAGGDGDALFSLWRYADATPGSAQAQALAEAIATATMPRWKPSDPLLSDLSRLTLDLGGTFVTDLYAQGGIAAVDAAVLRPPRSTEQLLHADRYLEDDAPELLTPLQPALGRGWVQTQTETLGEALLRLVLLEWSNGSINVDSIAHWGGDLLQVWAGPAGADAVLWQTTWDSNQGAVDFYGKLLKILPRPLLPGLIRDTTPAAKLPAGRWWAGRQGAIFLYRSLNHVWLVWGTDVTAVETIGAMLKQAD